MKDVYRRIKQATGLQAHDMLRDIAAEMRYTRSLVGKDALDKRVMAAIKKVPRHRFVPPADKEFSYANGPVPIGHGQTISQPFIVALMTDLLQTRPEDVVLEVGTGSGYQAAVLSLLVTQVYSVEIIPELAETATQRLKRLGYANVEVKTGDGYTGWAEHAPYDAIIVTAAPTAVPPALIEQLKPGGRLVIPVELPLAHQELMVVEKLATGDINTRDVLSVAFVPMTHTP